MYISLLYRLLSNSPKCFIIVTDPMHNLYWIMESIMHLPTPGHPHRAVSLMINTVSLY